MLNCRLTDVKRVLCLGAHSDDIEIGCGGTVLELIRRHPGAEFYWAVFSGNVRRRREARSSALAFLEGARVRRIGTARFRESYFPEQWAAIKDRVEKIRSQFEPDLVFTHYRDDRHQDHRVLSDLAWNTFRNHLILEYEIPKYDGDLAIPNAFVPLSEAIGRNKVRLLLRHFRSQATRHWFTEDLFWSVMRIRGMECGAHHAEAFHCRKILF